MVKLGGRREHTRIGGTGLNPLPGRKAIKYGDLKGLFLSEDLAIPEEIIRDFEPNR
jgi:hypothetical protein